MISFYWTKDVEEAKREQGALVNLVEISKSNFNSMSFQTGLAIGTAYEENTKTAFAVCVKFDRNGKVISDYIAASAEVDFDYIPGLLAFRVGPAICLAIDQVAGEIDLFLFDGQGIAHPANFGLASHIGVLFNKPSIGVTKKALFGKYSMPSKHNHTDLKNPKTKLTIGYCVSTGHEPFFISPGHQISLIKSLEIIKMISGYDYLPNPLKIVHGRANRLAREHWVKSKKRSKHSL